MATPTDNSGLVATSIKPVLEAIKSAISTQVLDNLPVLGGLSLKPYAEQLITEQVEQSILKELGNTQGKTTAEIKQALFNVLGESGLGLLQKLNGEGKAQLEDIQTPSDSSKIEFKFKLGKSFKDSVSLGANSGLPSVGLALNGAVTPEVKLGVTVGFGIDNILVDGKPSPDPLFIDVGDKNEIEATITTTLKDANNNPLKLGGGLGLFKIEATDENSKVTSTFAADLIGTNADANGRVKISDSKSVKVAPDPTLTASGRLQLKVATVIADFLPSLTTEFIVDGLNYDRSSGLTVPAATEFKNVSVNWGSFAEKVFGGLKDYTQVFTNGPLAQINKTKLPIINNTLAGIAQSFQGIPVEGVKSIAEFFQAIDKIGQLATQIGALGKPLDFGNYKVDGTGLNQTRKPEKSILEQITDQPSSASVAAFIDPTQRLAAALAPTNGNNSDSELLDLFPILKNPDSFVQLLLPQKPKAPAIDLFQYQTPRLLFEFELKPEPTIPVFGPIVLKFGASAGAGAQLKLGYDTKGFYLSNPDDNIKDPKLNSGQKLDKIFKVFGELDAKAAASVGFAEVAAGGGIFLGAGLKITPDIPKDPTENDPNELTKKRVVQLSDSFCAIEAYGELGVVLFASLSLELGFFSVTKRFNLARIKLIDYSSGKLCSGKYGVPNLPLSQTARDKLEDAGVIEREGTDKDDTIKLTATDFYVTGSPIRKNGVPINTQVVLSVSGLDPVVKPYKDVSLIVINAGAGNDLVEFVDQPESVELIPFSRDIIASGQLNGNAGDDTLIGGAGTDFLNGGEGNDVLNGKGGQNTAIYSEDPSLNNDTRTGVYNDTRTGVYVDLANGFARDGYGTRDTLINIQNVEGSQYNDYLIANPSGSTLDAGDGDDTLLGGVGDDVLLSGEGADFIDGGAGNDTITYLDSPAPVYVNLSSKNVTVRSPIFGITTPQLLANRGSGGDAQGDRVFNVERVHGSIYNDVLVAGEGGGRVDGYLGDDIIYAGRGADTLDGGLGNNWLSYSQSDLGVSVSLETGGLPTFNSLFALGSKAKGGYAEGDTIMMMPDSSNLRKQLDYSSFIYLEGSNSGDELEGDKKDNILRGLAGDDRIYGQAGNDVLIGGLGADYLNGAYEDDEKLEIYDEKNLEIYDEKNPLRSLTNNLTGGGNTASYAEARSGITVNLKTGFGSRGEATGDQLKNIQNLLGSAYGDVLIGDDKGNDINPGLSDVGIDTVDGGGGIDRLTVNYSLNDYGTSGVSGGFNDLKSGSLRRDLDNLDITLRSQIDFTDIERLFVIGTSQSDTLVGGNFNEGDIFFTGAGDDTIDGGLGADFIYADDGNDVVFDQMVNKKFGSNLGNLVNSQIHLDGGRGIDTLSIDLSAQSGGIQLESKDPTLENLNSLGGLKDGSTISGFEIFKDIKTGAGNDILTQLGQVNNLFITGAGDDKVNPGLGNDTVNGGDGNDTLILDYSEGDTGSGLVMTIDPKAMISKALRKLANMQTPLDKVEFQEFENYEVTGTSKGDTLMGNNGKDSFTGGAGADTFVLGDEYNVFYGNGNNSYALIKDFNPEEGDRLQLHRRAYIGESPDYYLAPSPTDLPSGIAVYTSDKYVNPIAIVQTVPGSSGLKNRVLTLLDDPLGNTTQEPFIAVGQRQINPDLKIH